MDQAMLKRVQGDAYVEVALKDKEEILR